MLSLEPCPLDAMFTSTPTLNEIDYIVVDNTLKLLT